MYGLVRGAIALLGTFMRIWEWDRRLLGIIGSRWIAIRVAAENV